ncbi:MAG: hypothetical protein RIB84_08050 [Sneathiellaceae bacterium]
MGRPERIDPVLMKEAEDPTLGSGEVAAVRQSIREPLPSAPPSPDDDGPPEISPPPRAHVPRTMMIVLAGISIMLGVGYLTTLFV